MILLYLMVWQMLQVRARFFIFLVSIRKKWWNVKRVSRTYLCFWSKWSEVTGVESNLLLETKKNKIEHISQWKWPLRDGKNKWKESYNCPSLSPWVLGPGFMDKDGIRDCYSLWWTDRNTVKMKATRGHRTDQWVGEKEPQISG